MNALSRFATILAMITVVVMMLITVADVFLRYFFSRPITGTTEIIELLMICLLLGMTPCALEKRHIKADVVIEHLPKKVRLILEIISYIIGVFLFFILAWQGYVAGLFALSYDVASSMLEMPTFPIYLILVLSFSLLCLAVITLIVKGISEVFNS